MCGILMAIQPEREFWSYTALCAATNLLAHRGPDASGNWQEEHVFLGHRRLSIIDLETGAQPMSSHDQRYVVTFNGEIYNYRALRAELISAGATFLTKSDTEVLLEAYRHWGVDALQHLNGMFAFAIWDRQQKTLFAARDRVGIKPLCWMLHQGALLISSTLEPFFTLPDLPRRLDYISLRNLLVFNYIPSPRTILADIQKLPPGHYLTWHPGQAATPKIAPYWQVPAAQVDPHFCRETLLGEVEQLLDQAVESQMVSDVPIGAFLSGGIDSSLLVAMMTRHSTQPVKTFSISFAQRGYDESSIAQLVATHLGTEHTVLPAEAISGDDVLAIIGKLDEPFADRALLPTVILAGMARQHVTVALSGDGGDELFGGYKKYLTGEDVLQNPWLPWSRPLKYMMDQIPINFPGNSQLYWNTLTPHERIRYQRSCYGNFPIGRKRLQTLLAPATYAQIDAGHFFDHWDEQARPWGDRYTMDLMMRTDIRTYLSENCLFKTDRASMIASLEVRVPYLDERLLDRILSLPATEKIKNGQLKSLLIPLAQRLLPCEVWDRPKHGFSVPIGSYMAGSWCTMITDVVNWAEANVPLFDYTYLRQRISKNQRDEASNRDLWIPLVTLFWLYGHPQALSF